MNFEAADIKTIFKIILKFLDNVTIGVNGKMAFSKLCKS